MLGGAEDLLLIGFSQRLEVRRSRFDTVVSSQEDVRHENVESSRLLLGSGIPSACYFSDARYVRINAIKISWDK